jgi:carboxypeptidase C (cathepsin A)
VGTGFSYGDSYVNNMQQISDETVQFLINFVYNEFPEYATRDLVITGESYAGKYLP